MTLKFSKEIIEKYELPGYGYFNNVKLYKVIDDQNCIGSFVQFNNTCLIKIKDLVYRIESTADTLTSLNYVLFAENSQAQIGNFIIPAWVHQYGKLIFSNDTFYCQKLNPDIKYSLLSRRTWGHYKIQMSNEASFITYNFRIKQPFITFPNSTKLRSFSGKIETNTGNELLLLAGLFFIDIVIAKDDKS